MEIRIRYQTCSGANVIDYTQGDVDPLVAQLARDGLGTSTVSLMLRLVSTMEELALHQEGGFVLESVKRR